MKDFILNLTQFLCDVFFYIYPQKPLEGKKRGDAKIVAHRGWHDNKNIIENTLKSFEIAVKHHVWAIEFDVRWTLDGVAVVHHDSNCKRLWGKDLEIRDVSFHELRALVPEIPTLKEVVSLFGKRIHLFIELKEEGFKISEIEKNHLDEVLSGLNPIEDYFLMSLSADVFKVFNQFPSKCYILVAQLNTFEMSRLALIYNYAGVAGHYLLCTQDIIDKHEKLEQKVGVGFIRTHKSLKRELKRNAAWIFTNHPWNLVEKNNSL